MLTAVRHWRSPASIRTHAETVKLPSVRTGGPPVVRTWPVVPFSRTASRILPVVQAPVRVPSRPFPVASGALTFGSWPSSRQCPAGGAGRPTTNSYVRIGPRLPALSTLWTYSRSGPVSGGVSAIVTLPPGAATYWSGGLLTRLYRKPVTSPSSAFRTNVNRPVAPGAPLSWPSG